jgi:hypothetical protein
MLIGGEGQVCELIVQGGIPALRLGANLFLSEEDPAWGGVDEEEAVHETVFGSGSELSEHGRLYAAEEGDEGFGDDDRLPHPALAVHDDLVARPERKPVLAIGALASLVLVHRADPAGELVLIDEEAAGVVLQDADQSLDGGVGGDAAGHRGGLWFFGSRFACFLGVALLYLPLSDFAFPLLFLFGIGSSEPALVLEGGFLGDFGGRGLHRSGRGDYGHEQRRPLAPAALYLDDAARAYGRGEGSEHGEGDEFGGAAQCGRRLRN